MEDLGLGNLSTSGYINASPKGCSYYTVIIDLIMFLTADFE